MRMSSSRRSRIVTYLGTKRKKLLLKFNLMFKNCNLKLIIHIALKIKYISYGKECKSSMKCSVLWNTEAYWKVIKLRHSGRWNGESWRFFLLVCRIHAPRSRSDSWRTMVIYVTSLWNTWEHVEHGTCFQLIYQPLFDKLIDHIFWSHLRGKYLLKCFKK